MIKKYLLTTLVGCLLTASSATAMEAPALAQELPSEQPTTEKTNTLQEIIFQKLISGKIDLGQAEICLHPELKKLVKQKLIHANLLFFADLFRPVSCTLLTGHRDQTNATAFSPNSCYALTGSNDKTVRLWDLKQTPPTSTVLEDHQSCISYVGFTPDAKRAITGAHNDVALIWNLAQNPPTALLLRENPEEPLYTFTALAVSTNNAYALTGFDDGPVARLWDLGQDPPSSTALSTHANNAGLVAVSPNGAYAITSDGTGICLWNMSQNPTILHEYRNTCPLTHASFSQNSSQLITVYSRTVFIWDLRGNRPVPRFYYLPPHTHDTSNIQCIAYNSDNKHILTGTTDGMVQLWDLTQKDVPLQKQLIGHKERISTVAFSPDGHFAITTSWDNAARLWDLRKDPIKSLLPVNINSIVHSAVFSPNGQFLLITGAVDGTSWLWDFYTEAEKLSLPLLGLLLKAHADKEKAQMLISFCDKLDYLELTNAEPAAKKAELCGGNPLLVELSTVHQLVRKRIAVLSLLG